MGGSYFELKKGVALNRILHQNKRYMLFYHDVRMCAVPVAVNFSKVHTCLTIFVFLMLIFRKFGLE